MKNQRLTRYLLFIIVSYFTIITSAHGEIFLVISDPEHKYHKNIVSLLENKLSDYDHEIINTSMENLDDHDLSNYSSLITIGYKSAASVIQRNVKKPVLSLLIPKPAFNLLLNKNKIRENRYLYSSIYIDQPIERQIRLINVLSPNFKNIGILYGKNSYSRKNQISKQLKNSGLITNNVTVLERTELISETRHLSENSDLLLAIPDSSIYNRRSIKGILLTTYRNKIPVIGFSKAYVKAGALAAVYSSPENITDQAVEILNKNIQHAYISATRVHPAYFEIETNKKVARSLNINIDNKDKLLKKLISLEPDKNSKLKPDKRASNRG